jgi:hypothetical protein
VREFAFEIPGGDPPRGWLFPFLAGIGATTRLDSGPLMAEGPLESGVKVRNFRGANGADLFSLPRFP